MKTKVCSKCRIEKPLSAFGKDNNRKDGHNVYCKECRSQKSKKTLERELLFENGKKKCSKCGKIKKLQDFRKNKKTKNGLSNQCKDCDREYRIKNKERIKQYKIDNKEEFQKYQKEYMKKYQEENREKLLKYKKDYYEENKEELNKKRREYYSEHQEELKKKGQEYYLKYREYINNRNREYAIKNRDRLRKAHQEWERNKRKTDINFRLTQLLRHRLWLALNGNLRVDKTLNLLGCSIEDFKKYLESKFKKGMNWNNYGRGGWHIDHIKPCASFDLSKEKEQRKCFFYLNLQPLWELENLKKGSKI